MRILPSLEAVDAHDGGDLGDEHLLNLRHSLHLWGPVSRVHVVVGGEGFGIPLVEVVALAPVCLRKRKVQKVKSAPHHVVLAPWRSGLKGTSTFYNPLELSSHPSVFFVFVFEKGMFPLFFFFFPSVPRPPPPPNTNISEPDREE